MHSQHYDDTRYLTRFVEEERDELFIDWIGQGGGTDTKFIDSHCHIDFLLDR